MWVHKALPAGVILTFMTINMMGAFLTGRAVFAAVGTSTMNMTRMAPRSGCQCLPFLPVDSLSFLAHEGFELIANTARDVKDPEKTLPKAYYSAAIFVIILYIWIAMVTVGNVSFEEAKKAQDYVLAVAAEPFFGKAGFIVIGIAALLSTTSAINATLYGGGRTSYLIAKYGELPSHFEKKFKNGYEGMIIIALLGIIFATSFSLDNISVAGSIGFLVVFSLVNFANFRP